MELSPWGVCVSLSGAGGQHQLQEPGGRRRRSHREATGRRQKHGPSACSSARSAGRLSSSRTAQSGRREGGRSLGPEGPSCLLAGSGLGEGRSQGSAFPGPSALVLPPHPPPGRTRSLSAPQGFRAVRPAGCRGRWVLSGFEEERAWCREEGTVRWRQLGSGRRDWCFGQHASILTGAAAGVPLRP